MTVHYECDVCGSTTKWSKDVHSTSSWHSIFKHIFDLGTNSHVCGECVERAKEAIEEEFE